MSLLDVDPTAIGTQPEPTGLFDTASTGFGVAARRAGLRAGKLLLSSVIALIAIGLLWTVFLHIFGVSSLVGKDPEAVAKYLFSGPLAASRRSSMLKDLWTTLTDAGVGFVIGLAAGVVMAALFSLYRPLEQSLMPIAMIVRSVPLVAMTPLIVLVFGRGLGGVTVIVAIVVFFPALVNMVFGLASAPRQSGDLVRAYGGGQWVTLFKVALPSSLPAFFAAARISVPGALIGGTLAEWLATGKGLGYRMEHDISTFVYADLWASVVLLTVTSLVLYSAVGVLESAVLARYGPAAGRN
jgi:ABC-type nitrate/sulfonate/bicarbonate transport system permease component